MLEELHAYVGRILAVTFILRVVWGFAGNKYARFSDMIPYTGERWLSIWANIKWYLGGCRAEPPVSMGHNPLASLFYLAFFFVLALQAVTGILLAGVEFDIFPGSLITGGLGVGSASS